ncbi:MAG: hypothetical protein HY674_13025 [Chloroflexi bacterium]|nr:hypothetical protein [Chloroflexota bacterium]
MLLRFGKSNIYLVGCESVLSELELVHEVNGTVGRLRNAIVKARHSLSFLQRIKAATGEFPKPVELDFPPGDFEASR